MYKIGEKEIRTVCIVGAGNEGHYHAAFIGRFDDIKVNILTSKPEGFCEYIESLNVQSGVITRGKINQVSSIVDDVIPESDLIIFAVPSNVYQLYLPQIYSVITEGTILGFVPGTGGVEFMVRDYIVKKHCPIFGSQRVPSGTKVDIRGKRVNALDQRRDIRIASIPSSINSDVCKFYGEVFDIKTIQLPNYLAVTFTPSNPILHTSRLYGLFHDYTPGQEWDHMLSFYKEWSDLSSEVLLGCNSELQQCCKLLSEFDLSGVASLVDHYEIYGMSGNSDVERMTNKIRSLIYMKDNAPMRQIENGNYVPNLSTRYFTEDFPYGLAILRDFCDVCNVKTPFMDKVLGWFDHICDAHLFKDGKLEGEGAKCLPLPHNYGISCKNELVAFYNSFEALLN